MWRALVFIGLLCLAAFAAVWLADHPGTIAVSWNGKEYLTSLAVGLVGVIVLAMVLALVWAAIRYLLGLPTRIGENSRRRRRTRGHAALSRGLVAVGAGDIRSARRYAAEAERLAGDEPLTLLLRAQTAQAAGDRTGAEAAFSRMLDNSDTRILGLRGLFLEARRRNDMAAARHVAEEATRIAPSVGWANDAMLEAYSADGDWNAALRAVERRASLGLADKTQTLRQRAVLHAADAIARDKAGDVEGALAAAQQALRLVPDLVPAAALAGRLLSRRGDLRRAAKVVETAWTTSQHPDLAAAYLNLRPGDSASDRLRRAENLARLSSWAPESRLAIGRAAIDAREFSRARETLRPLVEERPTVRVCLMMAELEQAEGQSGRVREWLARAARAPRDKAWIADGLVSDRWAPISPATGRLDAFVWDTPPDVIGASHDQAGFLDEVMREPEPEPAPAAPLAVPVAPPAATPVIAEPPAAPLGAPEILSLPIEPGKPAAPPLDLIKPAPVVEAEKPAAGPTPPPRPASESGAAVTAPPAAKPMPIPDEPLPEPPARADAAPSRATPSPGGGAPRATPRAREPEPVVFPFAHPPDDPGPKKPGDKRSLFKLGT